MPKIRIIYYDDGSILDIERVGDDAEPLHGLDSVIKDVSEDEADRIFSAFWTINNLKGLLGE